MVLVLVCSVHTGLWLVLLLLLLFVPHTQAAEGLKCPAFFLSKAGKGPTRKESAARRVVNFWPLI
jgi:hypothetical protein